MIYSAGTIAIAGAGVTGTGANFTSAASQVRAGQTLVVLTSPPQIFEIATVNSATSLTLTAAANPWLPAGTKYAILTTDALSVDGLAQSIAQLVRDYDASSDAWEAFAGTTANQTVTVSINGVSVTIPALGKLVQRGANGAVPVDQGGTGATTQAAARTSLGLGNSSTRDVGTAAGTVAAGNDSRLGTIDGKSGGTISGSTIVSGYLRITQTAPQSPAMGGNYQGWNTVNGQSEYVNHRAGGQGGHKFTIVNPDFTLQAAFTLSSDGNGYAGNGQWISATSGRATKTDIKEIENPRDKMRLIKAATWVYKSKAMSGKFGIGVIADELYEAFPEARITVGDVELDDGSIVEDALSVQAGDSGVTAALHHATILSLMYENEAQQNKIESQQVEIEALKSNLEELTKIVEGLIA
ncbi:tail fiber domain-containing protein [Atlantibacter subterraneus]|uniref:tail fiber domain-containing protein n=1 Tax=Atlantibacter subterraneus TaxID=255519 RepID=UPI0028B15F05|nr:tail fiber domain-containing protein [Atlantibacter subterranea]